MSRTETTQKPALIIEDFKVYGPDVVCPCFSRARGKGVGGVGRVEPRSEALRKAAGRF